MIGSELAAVVSIFRLVMASVLIFGVAMPVTDAAIKHFLEQKVTDLVPLSITDMVEEPSMIRGKGEMPAAAEQQATKANGSTMDASESRAAAARKVTKESTPVARVWAYGIQMLSLIGVLGVTLWAAVALLRSD